MISTEFKKVTIRELVRGYSNDGGEKVKALSGTLNVRPIYQREFVYKKKQQQALMTSLREGLPIGLMYWGKTGNNRYDVIDGQQRIISICEYCHEGSSLALAVRGKTEELFSQLGTDAEKILDTTLMVYVCECDNLEEKLQWFRAINTQGLALNEQELRNAAYSGSDGMWLEDAKKNFSKEKAECVALAKDFVSGNWERQDILEKALKWIADRDGCSIDSYMIQHVGDENAVELVSYFKDVISWARLHFGGITRKCGRLDKIEWGLLYNEYVLTKHVDCTFIDIVKEIGDVRDNYEVQSKTSAEDIIRFILAREHGEAHPDRFLNLRAFSDTDKSKKYFEVGRCCQECGKEIALADAHADHSVPWFAGGKTEYSNLRILCSKCNQEKSSKMWAVGSRNH